eukprot:jgi/Tetstr1/463643/TSEL_008504.t1
MANAMTGAKANEEGELELNYKENDSTMDVDTAIAEQRSGVTSPAKHQRHSIHLEQRPRQPLPAGNGKAAASVKHKKKHPRSRSRSGGTTRNRNESKPRLSCTHDSDSEWETDDEAAQPSGSSHQ